MKTTQTCRPSLLRSPSAWLATLAALAVAGCGGGGGDGGDSVNATVSASSATAVRYGETMTITLVGTGLDGALTLSSPGCRSFARSTTAPLVSTATTAYHTCTVSGATGAQEVTVSGGGAVLARVPFNTPVPQVTMLVSNGAAVSGSVVVTLNPTAAPATVDNFLAYVRAGFYNGTVFHRLLNGFVLQGGGFSGPMSVSATALNSPKATNPAIVLEDNSGQSNLRFTIAMARTGAPDSATSQFFINLADNGASLDRTAARRGYAVFGTITAGTDVITAATTAPCSPWGTVAFGDGSCLPVPNLSIASASQTR